MLLNNYILSYVRKLKKTQTVTHINQGSLLDLPIEILVIIFDSINDPKSFSNTAKTCSFLRDICKFPDVQRNAKNRFTIKKKIKTYLKDTYFNYYVLPNGTKHGPYEVQLNPRFALIDLFSRFVIFTTDVPFRKQYFKISTQFKEGKLDGHFKITNANGIPFLEGNYKDGKRHGKFMVPLLSSDNICKYECNYIDDVLEGHYKSWTDSNIISLLEEIEHKLLNYKNGLEFNVLRDNQKERSDLLLDITESEFESSSTYLLSIIKLVQKEEGKTTGNTVLLALGLSSLVFLVDYLTHK